MSTPDRRALVDRGHGELPVRRQCQLLEIARSGIYRLRPAANDDDDPALLRRIDELHHLAVSRLARVRPCCRNRPPDFWPDC
jgi:hypothetical protein